MPDNRLENFRAMTVQDHSKIHNLELTKNRKELADAMRELALFAGAGGGILAGHLSDGAQSAQSNMNPMPLLYSSSDKMMEFAAAPDLG